jgi:hypothetical protein
LAHDSGMPELIVTASIIEAAPARFVVVVSSAPAQSETSTHTDVEIADAATLDEARGMMRRLIGEVVDRAERRGDRVRQVKRIVPAVASDSKAGVSS